MAPPAEKKAIREAWKQNYPRDLALREKLSRQICAIIAATPEFRAARWVGIFSKLPWEPDLTPLWTLRPEACVFPATDPPVRAMAFYSVKSLAELVPGHARIPEPSKILANRVDKWTSQDLILAPGHGFDESGGRIGSGEGFYDRFLQGLPVQKWGICFSEQIAKGRFAQEATDVRMDAVVTPLGKIERKS